jgi:RNA polymerase sigma-70 factor (TIGR02957 family)
VTGRAEGPGDPHDLRSLLFSIAYRMLGAVTDAEDVVQEAYLRLQRASVEGAEVESSRAFLTTVTTRLAIDQLRSARRTREKYFGPWLPEPLLTAEGSDPAELAEMSDLLSLSFLVLLETLSPVERAVFVLRHVFDYGYDEIAVLVQKSEANCRQIFVRARRRIDEGRTRFKVDPEQQDALATKFIDAVREGEVSDLAEFLARDVVFYGDGGGKGRGLPRPVYGRDKVNRLLLKFFAAYREIGSLMVTTEVNGEPGVLALDAEGRLINVFAFEVAEGAIQTVRSIINPNKLSHLGYPLSDLGRAAGGEPPR